MTVSLPAGDRPFATICLACAEWLPQDRVCTTCEQTPLASWWPFYKLALHIEATVSRSLASRYRYERDRILRVPPDELHYGASTELVAIVSAVMLGIVSNAGYDLIKTWLLSSRKRREAQQRVIAIFEYQVIVELVVKYFQEYPDVETTIRTSQELHEISFSEVKERITGDLESEPDAPDTSTRTR